MTFSYKLLRSVLALNPHITCRKSKGVAKCSECETLKEQVKYANTPELRVYYERKQKLHHALAYEHRSFLQKHNIKAQ